MTSLPIFHAADPAILTRRNLIQPAVRRRRQISSSLMLSEALSSSSSSSGESVDSGVSLRPLRPSFTVPEYIESVEALEYIGWGDEKAAELWARWEILKQTERNEATFETDFLEYALSAVPCPKLEDRQEDWNAEMLNWGVKTELREAIMDEAYTNIRLTETAQYWVKDTMEIRYLSLERLQRDSQMRAQTSTTSTSNTNNTTNTRGNPVVIPQPATSSTVPGSLALYKAIAKDRVRQDSTGKISIESLVSGIPSDFRGVGGTTLYFTPSLQVAEHYRGYIRRRYEASAPLMLALSIPNSFIEAIPPYILPFGDLWKEIVYTSRRGLLLRGDLKRIHRLPLIIAPIAQSYSRTISSLDDYHQISSPRHVLHVEDSEAIQYVFQGDDMLYRLEEYGEVKDIS
ncbi:uncharacterized protein LY89DRAFT_681195 [Mollisia scopiformis]|uniref:Uncharacterized protein n=1 Tax=Mollisia scopiformis TaxID=149040 RepID=A0A194XNH8_MOLSC|nr:uncharacterized protein LY89DRAFT_681195 [Mollisia scopiformis]KUJ21800.1 hypothetical protein LY89DRAFT_681195 [Mollisia scopiformis]